MPPPFPLPIVTKTVVASPAAAAETVIAQLVVGSVADPTTQIDLSGWAAYTVGTTGNAVTLNIRRTGVSGTLVSSTGALTGSQHGAGILSDDDVEGLDTPGEVASLVYVLTMTVGAATAVSTVSAVKLRATIIG